MTCNLEPREKEVLIDDAIVAVDWLMYRSYEFNRNRSPHIEPHRWRAIYLYAEKYEKIYQSINADKGTIL